VSIVLVDTYKSSNGEEGEYDRRLYSALAELWIVVRRTPPRVSQVAEADEPQERPEACTTPANGQLD